jgi:ribonuclease BN (tRNA processing enzyme)
MPVSVRFVGSGDAFGSGGRFQACILIDGSGSRLALDFGTSSLIALAQQGIDHNSIDAVLVTHFHGDHWGGLPFLLMDAMLAAKRTRPLTIVGPRETRARLADLCETLFPGMHQMRPTFALTHVELEAAQPTPVLDVVVVAEAARHTAQTNPLALRIEVGSRAIAYTGDGEWTEALARLGRDVDLLIAECYFYAKPVKWHLNYPTLREHLGDVGAKRVILTHMSREMLAHARSVPEECAWDGLTVEVE